MQGVILAAGKGLRLRPITETVPKALVDVCGTPLIFHILNSLPATVTEIFVVVGYLGEQIVAAIGDAFDGKSVRYVTQDPGLLKKQKRARIAEVAVRRKLDQDLRYDWRRAKPTDEQVAALDAYLDELEESRIPVGMHTHGVANDPRELRQTMVEILGPEFLAKAGGDRQRAAERVGSLMAATPAIPVRLAGFERPFAPTPGTGKRAFAPETQPAQPAPIAEYGKTQWRPDDRCRVGRVQ